MKLSVVLATRNEEANIARCLDSIKTIADEIIIFDEHSTDETRTIARKYGAKVFEVDHEPIFHVTKQKAIDKASGDWILQLDADEEVSPELADEIREVLQCSDSEILARRPKDNYQWSLFMRHQAALEARDGKLGKETGEVVAFFLPRVNMFLGHPLIHGGVYPDGAIRLIKKGKAYLPAKSVHEIMAIDGEVAWLFSPLLHYDSPTVKRYLERLNRYTDLQAEEFSEKKVPKSLLYIFLSFTYWPLKAFCLRFLLRAGFKDGLLGFVWAVFSSWHFPIAYFKYYLKR